MTAHNFRRLVYVALLVLALVAWLVLGTFEGVEAPYVDF
jgi:hypothetical protein